MAMSDEKEVVLCVSNCYQKKFYLNPVFEKLPKSIKEELQIMCVLYTEDVSGILMIVFNEDGELELRSSCEEGDFYYDSIGAVLKAKKLRSEKRELLEGLELYYKIQFLGQGLE